MLAGAFMILLGIFIWTDSLRKFLGLFWSLTHKLEVTDRIWKRGTGYVGVDRGRFSGKISYR
jgi:hypothetical protein